MSGWWASDNTFIDVQNAFLINGGTQNVATRNNFKQVDNCVWLSVEYSDLITYQNLVHVAMLPAWQKYKNFGGAAPRHTTNWGLSSYAPGRSRTATKIRCPLCYKQTFKAQHTVLAQSRFV